MWNKQLRNVVRLVHLLVAAFMAVFIYSPLRLDPTVTLIAQVVVVPVVALSGLVMWQPPTVVKFLNRGRTPAKA